MPLCLRIVLTSLIWVALVASVMKTHAAGSWPYMHVVLTGLLATVSGAAAFSLFHSIAPECSLQVGRYVYVDGPRASMAWSYGKVFAGLRVMLALPRLVVRWFYQCSRKPTAVQAMGRISRAQYCRKHRALGDQRRRKPDGQRRNPKRHRSVKSEGAAPLQPWQGEGTWAACAVLLAANPCIALLFPREYRGAPLVLGLAPCMVAGLCVLLINWLLLLWYLKTIGMKVHRALMGWQVRCTLRDFRQRPLVAVGAILFVGCLLVWEAVRSAQQYIEWWADRLCEDIAGITLPSVRHGTG
jgi:hypothetical protein